MWKNPAASQLAREATRTIEIDEFVDRSEIEPGYLIRPYLRPDGRGGYDALRPTTSYSRAA